MKRLVDDTIHGNDNKRARLDSANASRHDSPLNSNDTRCSACRQIDFDNVLKHRILKGSKRRFRIAYLSHIDRDNQCQLCAFFRAVRPRHWKTSGTLYLLCAFGESVFGLPAQAADCLLLGVTRNCNEAPETYFMDLSRNRSPFKTSVIEPLIDFHYLRTINNFCVQNHRGSCRRKVPLGLHNFRVIDCATRKLVTMDDASIPFLTLSYLWGEAGGDNEDVDHELPKRIPATIEDAMTVTIELGYRYLWVDRYCIRQRHNSEKAELIQSMGRIYSASTLTIIAASGSSASAGLPGVSVDRSPQSCLHIDEYDFVSFVDPVKDSQAAPWNARGWTYQEGLLARRRLLFTASQVYFQCFGLHCSESFSCPLDLLHKRSKESLPASVNIRPVFPQNAVGYSAKPKHPDSNRQAMALRIREYCGRNLTYEVDRLSAFEGIMNAFLPDDSRVVHLHGLILSITKDPDLSDELQTSKSIIQALFWLGHARLQRFQMRPSWTWAGWKPRITDPSGAMDFVTAQFCNGVALSRLWRPLPYWHFKQILADIHVVRLRDGQDFQTLSIRSEKTHMATFLSPSLAPQQILISGWTFELHIDWSSVDQVPQGRFGSFDRTQKAIESILQSPNRFDIWRGETEVDKVEKLVCSLIAGSHVVAGSSVTAGDLRPGSSWLQCLVLKHQDGQYYERAGTVVFILESARLREFFSEDFERALNPRITWQNIVMV